MSLQGTYKGTGKEQQSYCECLCKGHTRGQGRNSKVIVNVSARDIQGDREGTVNWCCPAVSLIILPFNRIGLRQLIKLKVPFMTLKGTWRNTRIKYPGMNMRK